MTARRWCVTVIGEWRKGVAYVTDVVVGGGERKSGELKMNNDYKKKKMTRACAISGFLFCVSVFLTLFCFL
jgi:hypothetical protein